MGQVSVRHGLWRLFQYLLLVNLIVLANTALFQLIMRQVEGQSHSWPTALYWTVVTMTTLGYGDVVFVSDVGRFFSLLVLGSGVILLVVVLPFVFIRFVYGPWLEAQIRVRAPQNVPSTMTNHVIISRHDNIAVELIERLDATSIPYYVVEGDASVAGNLIGQGVAAINGDLDERATYEKLQLDQARLLLANCADTTNTNIAITAREVSDDVTIASFAEHKDSIDILELSGCNHVLALKRQLGEYLANRVSGGVGAVDDIGQYKWLHVAEFSARETPFAGQSIRNTNLRQRTGLNIVGIWKRGNLHPAFPDVEISETCSVVVAGTQEQLGKLDELLHGRETEKSSGLTIVIGAGSVGAAAVRALKHKGVMVHVVERNAEAADRMRDIADRVVVGDANDRTMLEAAGLADATAVLLTPSDDAVNIYLSVYCRRLKPSLRLVSRIVHHRNHEAIHRAGVDFALSYSTIGAEAVMAIIEGQEFLWLGEDVDVFTEDVPKKLVDKTLGKSGIGSILGLSVVAIEHRGQLMFQLHASTQLAAGDQLVMLGTGKQRQEFTETFD